MRNENQKIPEVPEVPEAINVNSECADIENWDDKAFPLMIEPLVPLPPGQEAPFTVLSVEACETIYALLTNELRLINKNGQLVQCDPVVKSFPEVERLTLWLKGASASLRSRRSRR